MFFMRLRRGAKWVFVVLIVVFAFGFLFQGVGSGGGGDIISELLNLRGAGDPVKSAESAVKEHPKVADNWVSLAQLYEGKGRHNDAIAAYEKVLKLKPNDPGALAQLQTIWRGLTYQHRDDYVNLQQQMQDAQGPSGGSDPVATFLGTGGNDPLLTPYLNNLNSESSTALSAYSKAASSWEAVSRRYAKTVPSGDKFGQATVQLQLAEAAQAANDLPTEIKALKAYLRLAPGSTNVKQVREALAAAEKALKAGQGG
jgi:hypothetical protein